MLKRLRICLIAVSLLLAVVVPIGSRADVLGHEIWMGAGVSWPEYRDMASACARGGIGAILYNRVTLGVSAHADRERWYYFADAGLILPSVWGVEPYGRFQIGHRDDVDDTATGWVGGVRFGDPDGSNVHVFLEGHGVVEPQKNNGISFGLSF
jgi:hypothetical protein